MMNSFWDIRSCGFLPNGQTKECCFELSVFEDLCKSIPDYFGFNNKLIQNDLAGPQAFINSVEALPKVQLYLSMEDAFEACHAPPGPRSNPSIVLETVAQQERVFTIFGFLTNAFVRAVEARRTELKLCKDEPITIPETIGAPLNVLAHALGRAPIVDYASSVLTNWRIINENEPISFENIEILTTFSHLESEEWFYKTHIVIESCGADVIRGLQVTVREMVKVKSLPCGRDAVSSIVDGLQKVAVGLGTMNVALKRMTERCKDNQFYDQIRPWLASFPPCGVIYDGVSDEVMKLSGASGAQSSLLPCIDAFLGIKYHNDKDSNAKQDKSQTAAAKFRELLSGYRKHMPPPHRQLLAGFEQEFQIAGNNIRAFIERMAMELQSRAMDEPMPGNPQMVDMPLAMTERDLIFTTHNKNTVNRLKHAYNDCIECVIAFRRLHAGFATMYIKRMAKMRARQQAEMEAKQNPNATTQPRLKMEKGGVKGTGGSDFTTHLMRHVTMTRKCLFDTSESKIEAGLRAKKEESYPLPGLGRSMPNGSVFAGMH